MIDDNKEGHWAFAEFTPFTDKDTLNALLDFNLDCLSRWKGCRTASELMPKEVALYKANSLHGNALENGNFLEHLPIWIAARDAEFVAISEVVRTPRGTIEDNHGLLPFRVRKLLKGPPHISVSNSIYMTNTIDSEGQCSISTDNAHRLQRGMKILAVFNEPLNQETTLNSYHSACVIWPLTDENLARAQFGVARDSILRPAIVDF